MLRVPSVKRIALCRRSSQLQQRVFVHGLHMPHTCTCALPACMCALYECSSACAACMCMLHECSSACAACMCVCFNVPVPVALEVPEAINSISSAAKSQPLQRAPLFNGPQPQPGSAALPD
eukprot:365245-Chlamydomonas_euryale.AAC.8